MADKGQYLMRGLLHAFYWCDESLQNRLRESGYPALSRTKSMIMVNVSDGITRSADLARNLGISRQAIQQTLGEMEADGLLSLKPDPTDRRAKIVQFSRRGRGIGTAAFEVLSEIEQELAKRLGKRAVEELKKALFSDWGAVITGGSGEVESGRAMTLPRRRAIG